MEPNKSRDLNIDLRKWIDQMKPLEFRELSEYMLSKLQKAYSYGYEDGKKNLKEKVGVAIQNG